MLTVKREPMSVDLLRQRRNLLVTSLILIAINLAGAKPKKEVSVLGAGIAFESPERLVWGIWVLWAYFLLRYWQYLNEVPNLGIRDGIEDWILHRHEAHLPEGKPVFQIEWTSWFRWNILEVEMYTPGVGVDTSTADPKGFLIKTRWTLRALISVACKTPRFTDYFLPLLVAAIPVLLAIWSHVAAY